MREALSALTTRGRAFLAAGVTAFLCAVGLGYDELVRVGALLVFVPLATAFFLGRSRYRLGLVRTVAPQQVVAGQPTRVTLDLSNDGRMPTGLLLLEDQIPYVLGSRPRFVIDRMGPRWRRQAEYQVRSEVRGKFTIGPMKVRLSDPFGMVELDRNFQTTSSLVVTPRVHELPVVPLSGAWTGSGDNRPRSFASGSAEDVTVREYRRGDDLRRVHWRSSAHAGDLMVRREEQPWQSRATLFLDNRAGSHRGAGAGSSLEYAVSLAASIGTHLIRRGFTIRFVAAAGAEGLPSWHDHGSLVAESGPLLESLAMLTESRHTQIDGRWLGDGTHAGLMVAVLGQVTERDRPVLTRMRHASASAMAIDLDVAEWNREPSGHHDATGWLAAHGWRAISAGPRDTIPAVWTQLGLSRAVSGRGQPAPSGSPVPSGSPEGAS